MKFKANMLNINTDGHQVKLCSKFLRFVTVNTLQIIMFIFVRIFCTYFVYIKSVGVSQCHHI